MLGRDAEEAWIEFWISTILPSGGAVALFSRSSENLVAYFDESMEPTPLPMMSVAGYLFEPSEYVVFDTSMRALLREKKLCYFRMTECNNRIEQFARYKNTDSAEPLEIEKEVIRLIRKHAMLGVCAAMSEAKYELLQPRHMENVMGSAYTALCQWCLAEIGKWADRERFSGEIACYFESGAKDQREANRVLDEISRHPQFSKWYRYGSHGFIGKMKARGLQAADLYAWFGRREALAEAQMSSGGSAPARRKDFQALIGATEEQLKHIKHSFKYFDDESLKSFLSDEQNTDPALRWYRSAPAKRLPQ